MLSIIVYIFIFAALLLLLGIAVKKAIVLFGEQVYLFHTVFIPQYPHLTFYKGTQKGFTRFFKNNTHLDETIVGSSAKTDDGTIWAVMACGRHGHCLHALNELNAEPHQGFITSYGRHVDRFEAYEIAVKQNQILKKSGNPDSVELFSEDVWDTVPPYKNKLEKLKQSFIEDPVENENQANAQLPNMIGVILSEYIKHTSKEVIDKEISKCQ